MIAQFLPGSLKFAAARFFIGSYLLSGTARNSLELCLPPSPSQVKAHSEGLGYSPWEEHLLEAFSLTLTNTPLPDTIKRQREWILRKKVSGALGQWTILLALSALPSCSCPTTGQSLHFRLHLGQTQPLGGGVGWGSSAFLPSPSALLKPAQSTSPESPSGSKGTQPFLAVWPCFWISKITLVKYVSEQNRSVSSTHSQREWCCPPKGWNLALVGGSENNLRHHNDLWPSPTSSIHLYSICGGSGGN